VQCWCNSVNTAKYIWKTISQFSADFFTGDAMIHLQTSMIITLYYEDNPLDTRLLTGLSEEHPMYMLYCSPKDWAKKSRTLDEIGILR
jgi:hypothetical protein